MRWLLLLALTSGCRIGFHDSASTILEDAGVDAESDAAIDAPPGTRIVTFGERPGSLVQNVTADAYVIQSVDTFNYGASWDMSVYGNFERGFLRFDLSSLATSEVVLAATLELNIENSNDQVAGMFLVNRIDETWTEGSGEAEVVPGVSWQSRDGTTAWTSPGGTGNLALAVEPVDAIVGPITLPLLVSEVQAWIATPASNRGMSMMSPDGGHWHVTSKENDGDTARPQLRLLLQDP